MISEFNDKNISISINAIVDCEVPIALPSYQAKLQTWDESSIADQCKFGLLESVNMPQVIDIEDGKALLFDENTYESMVFLHDPNASWRYMNGRAETNYVNALNGLYVQYTYDANDIKNEILLNHDIELIIKDITKSLADLQIEMGTPIQCTAYYLYNGDQIAYD